MAPSILNEKFENTILSNLIYNEEFARKTVPFLKEEFFRDRIEIIVFKQINNFITKYNNLPTREALTIELSNLKNITEEEFKQSKQLLNSLQTESNVDQQWLLDTTEKFCKDRAVHNAVLSGIKILDGKDKKQSAEAIPHILSDALAVSFDNRVGHDYFKDAEARFEYYHKKEKRIPFDLEFFNKRAIFVYLRELSGLNSSELSSSLSNIRKIYKKVVGHDKKWDLNDLWKTQKYKKYLKI